MKDMNRVQRGFTVIEVMLFLAVSGALAAGILGTVGSTIGAQRYRDAVDAFESYIQGQYNQTINVRNDLDRHAECVDGAFSPASLVQAGTSTCAVIGRFIQSNDGRRFESQPIYMSGVTNNFVQSGTGDNTVFAPSAADNRRVFVNDSAEKDNYSLDWGTETQAPESGANAWSIAIVRSPVSGVIHTYTSRRVLTLQNLLSNDNRRENTVICINPSGWLVGQTLGVTILADAPGASSVRTGTEGC